MSRIHINAAGEPGECHAEFQCPFGGDEAHHDSFDEARESYEKEMKTNGFIFKSHKFGAPPFVPATEQELSESRSKAKDVVDNKFFNVILTQSDRAFVQRVLDGKKISDEKLDSFLDRNFGLDKDGYTSNMNPDDSKVVLDHLRLVRAQSQTPSTLTKLENFDPATQSVVSPKVRSDPNKMFRAISKSLNSIKNLQKLSDDNYWLAENDDKLTDKERKFYRGRAEQHLELSKREEVRVDAIFTEMKWKFEKDPEFALKANPQASYAVKRFKLVAKPEKYSVGIVRKVTDE